MDVLTGSSTTPPQALRCKTLYEDAREYFSGWHRAQTEELDFALKLNHYVDDVGNTKDRRRIQPKGIELFNLIRHKAAQIAKAGMYREARPVDDMTDPQIAELAKFCLEHILDDPARRYSEHRERMVIGALAARYWGMKWWYDPSDGPFGEINFATVDPRRLYWAPGYFDPMEGRCPWLIEHVPMTLDELHQMKEQGWNKKAIDAVHPNSQVGDRNATTGLDAINLNGTAHPSPRNTGTPIVDVLFCRFKRDPTQKKQTVDPYRKLPDNQRYMQCELCAWKSPPQLGLPPSGPPCEACGMSLLKRVDHELVEEQLLAYPDGRLTVIDAVSQAVFYDDKWPEKLRGFPYAIYMPYLHPAEPVGTSDTALHWSMQCTINAMFRLGYEQMQEAKGILVLPEDGLVDAHGEPWIGSDANGRVAFRSPDANPHEKIDWFQPPGLNSAWATYVGAVDGKFRTTQGTSDLGLTPTSSKDIAVGTVKALQETGELPVDHHVMRLRNVETYINNNVHDMQRATWSEARYVRVMGPAGQMAVQAMRGADIPSADFRLYAEPSLHAMEMDKIQAIMQIAAMPPNLRRFTANALGIAPSALRQLEMDEQAAMQAQPKPGNPGGAPGAEGPSQPQNGSPAALQAA